LTTADFNKIRDAMPLLPAVNFPAGATYTLNISAQARKEISLLTPLRETQG
jgi:hypothetical protein